MGWRDTRVKLADVLIGAGYDSDKALAIVGFPQPVEFYVTNESNASNTPTDDFRLRVMQDLRLIAEHDWQRPRANYGSIREIFKNQNRKFKVGQKVKVDLFVGFATSFVADQWRLAVKYKDSSSQTILAGRKSAATATGGTVPYQHFYDLGFAYIVPAQKWPWPRSLKPVEETSPGTLARV